MAARSVGVKARLTARPSGRLLNAVHLRAVHPLDGPQGLDRPIAPKDGAAASCAPFTTREQASFLLACPLIHSPNAAWSFSSDSFCFFFSIFRILINFH